MKQKNHTKNFKAKVALAAIKCQKTTSEIASEFGIHISQVNRWKKEALEALPEVFGSKKDTTIKGMETERDLPFSKGR
jgi:transposase